MDDYYNGQLLNIIGGTGSGQTRLVTDYVGSTKTATVSPNWNTTPATGSSFDLAAFSSASNPTAVQIADEVQTRTITALSSTERTAITNAILDLAATIDGKTLRQTLRYISGSTAAKLSGASAGAGTIVVRNMADTLNLFTVTQDAFGNRIGIVYHV